jgi:hypothetical protein
MRERRLKFAAALDQACLTGDSDIFVEAVMSGVAVRDPTCMKLCASYRFGPPDARVEVTGADGAPLSIRAEDLTDDQLAAIVAQGQQG